MAPHIVRQFDSETWSRQPRPCESNEWCLALEGKENGSSSLKTSDKLSAPESAEGHMSTLSEPLFPVLATAAAKTINAVVV
jgi:hypothetical protein